MRLFFQKTNAHHLAYFEARKFLFIILLVIALLPVQPAQAAESQISLVQEELNGLEKISLAVDTSEIPDIKLTAKERQWLKDHPVITLGGGIFPPLDFVNEDGWTVGVGPSYTDLVGEKLGVTFKYISGNWSEIQQMARERKIDGIRLLEKNIQREEYLSFSKPYASFADAIYCGYIG